MQAGPRAPLRQLSALGLVMAASVALAAPTDSAAVRPGRALLNDTRLGAVYPAGSEPGPPVVAPPPAESWAGPVPLVDPAAAAELLAARAGAAAVASLASETEITPEIEALARGLRNDPSLLYELVRNGVDYAPIFGALRSATTTWHDRRGNDFDQAALLIALLRAAGHDAEFVYGQIALTLQEAALWLGTPASAAVVNDLLSHAGVPATVAAGGVTLSHVWVRASIGGVWYAFDPSYKTYASAPGIDLAAALGYDRAVFLARATQGMSSGPGWLQNVNRANVRGDLVSLAGNLASTIRTAHPAARLADIVGGRSIVPVEGAPLATTLPYEVTRTATWSEVPAAYRTTLRIQHLGIDETLAASAVLGKRLTIFYGGSWEPYLILEGDVVAVGTPGQQAAWTPIILSVDHPYAANGGTYGDASSTQYLNVGGAYFITLGADRTSHATVQRHQRRLALALDEGQSAYSEPVLGETLAVVGTTWLADCSRSQDLSDQLAGTLTVQHHVLGVIGQTDAPWMDMPMAGSYVTSLAGDAAAASGKRHTQAGVSSAFEWGAIAQTQPSSAVSTVKLLDAAAASGTRLFDTTSADWASVKPQLSNYTPYALAGIESYITAGYRVILPQVGTFYDAGYKGVGYLVVAPDGEGLFHLITGGLLYGGYANYRYVADPYWAARAQVLKEAAEEHRKSQEPVDLVTGAFLHGHTDLAVGSQPFPFGLELTRSYSSLARLVDGPLGRGWSHNWQAQAVSRSNAFLALGEAAPVDAAAAIACLYVSLDLLHGTMARERLVIATLVQRFMQDNLIDNAVEVTVPDGARTFVRLADGSFDPPPGSAEQLTRPGGSYRLRGRHGELLDFDGAGRLATWADPNGNTVTLTYGASGLASVGNGMTRSLSLTYEGDRIKTVSDGGGRTVAFAYDGSGNLTSAADPLGHAITYEYDRPGRLTRVLLPANPTLPIVTNTYDDLDRVTRQRDGAGNPYDYYFGGGRTEEVDPTGSSRVVWFDERGRTVLARDPLGHETSCTIDGQGRLTRTVQPEGNAVELEYDAHHNVTRFRRLPKPGFSADPIVTQLAYEPTFNRMTSLTNALGKVTTYSYDARGNLTGIDPPEVDGSVPSITFTVDSRGQVTRTDRPGGVSETRSYDPATGDLLSAMVDPGGLGLTTSFVYDTVGNVTTRTDPRGKSTGFAYDAARRMSAMSELLGVATSLGYNADDELTSIARQTGDAGQPTQTTAFTFTVDGRRASATDPLGHTTSYQHDAAGRLWKVTDAMGRSSQLLYDAAGRPFRQINPLGQTVEEQGYTPNGRTATLKDGKGRVTSFTYDAFDRPLRVTYADGSFGELGHDVEGNVTQERLRSGAIVTATYDALNQLRSRTYPGSLVTSFGYDANGRLVTASDAGGSISHTYDKAGRLVGVTYPGGTTVGHELDAGGNLTKLVYPDASFVTYAYDDLGRMTDVRDGASASLAHYTYDPLSRRTGVTFGNGASTTYTWDLADNLTSIHHGFVGGSVDLAYGWDEARGLASVRPSSPVLEFDPGEVASDTFTPNALNGIATANGSPYTYDGNGNLTAAPGRTYAWDARNRLAAATAPGHTSSYTYDALDRRTSKTVDGAKTSYLLDGANVLMETDGSGATLRRYVWGPHVDEPILMQGGAGSFYYHADHLGSVVAMSNATGAPAETYTYGPYGEPGHTSSIGNGTLFAGREYDAETGLYYNRARYYAPNLGRFLSMDPVGFAGGDLNLYGYAFGNPVMYTDPRGEFPVFHAILGGLAVTIIIVDALDVKVRVDSLPQSATAQAKGPVILLGPDYDKLHPAVQRAVLYHEEQHKWWDWWQVYWKSPLRSELLAAIKERKYLLEKERPRYEKKGATEALAAIDREIKDLDDLLANDAANLRQIYDPHSLLGKAGNWVGKTLKGVAEWAMSDPIYNDPPLQSEW